MFRRHFCIFCIIFSSLYFSLPLWLQIFQNYFKASSRTLKKFNLISKNSIPSVEEKKCAVREYAFYTPITATFYRTVYGKIIL